MPDSWRCGGALLVVGFAQDDPSYVQVSMFGATVSSPPKSTTFVTQAEPVHVLPPLEQPLEPPPLDPPLLDAPPELLPLEPPPLEPPLPELPLPEPAPEPPPEPPPSPEFPPSVAE